jgi:hypothetical protein
VKDAKTGHTTSLSTASARERTTRARREDSRLWETMRMQTG